LTAKQIKCWQTHRTISVTFKLDNFKKIRDGASDNLEWRLPPLKIFDC